MPPFLAETAPVAKVVPTLAPDALNQAHDAGAQTNLQLQCREISQASMTWDNPHWSGRPQPGPGPRQKLRPNAFARLARFSASHASIVVLLYAVLAMICGSYAASVLSIDPDRRPRITLDANTAKLQAELARQFPAIEQTFLAVTENGDPKAAREQALALANALNQRVDLFLSAFVPGTAPFYEANAMLFRDLTQVSARVDALIQMEPLHYALASAPDIVGFASLVNEIGKSVVQGRSPPGLEAMLLAAAAAIEAEVKGAPEPVDWVALAGLDGEMLSQRWYVLATPRPGLEPAAAAAARAASQGMAGVTWLWPQRALATAPSTLRDFVVPASLSVLLASLLTAVILGSVRHALAVLLCSIVALCCAAAAAAAAGRPLDGATWSFALAVLAPVFVAGSILATSFAACRAKGVAISQSVMLAGQRQGALVSAIILLFAAMWLSWVPRQLPSLSQFAVIALLGCAVAWLVAMTLLPAALALLADRRSAEQPNWLDEALGGPPAPHGRNLLDALTMIVLASAVFCAAFLPAVRFGERQLPSSPPPLIETPDARGAVHILAPGDQVEELAGRLAALPEVGAIRTASQFLPPQAPAKVAELRRLAGLTPFEPAFRGPADAIQLAQSFAALEAQLTAIAVEPATSPALKEAALRLRRAVTLFIAPQPPTPARVAALEKALFGGLAELSALTARLASLEVPDVSSLDPRLRRRFVSEEGTWRIEVMPRNGTGQLSFAAALRRAVPQSAGEPMVFLARNEIIHHETMLALATALALAALLVLAALRNVTGWVLALAPAAAFVTLTAAVSVLLGISLNASMLAGLTAATAVLIASSMRLADHIAVRPGPASGLGPPLRAALLPPLALAGAVGPLALSSRPSVAEVGAALGLLLVIAALLSILLVPVLARWFGSLAGGRVKRLYERLRT
jgi:hypothetical protein